MRSLVTEDEPRSDWPAGSWTCVRLVLGRTRGCRAEEACGRRRRRTSCPRAAAAPHRLPTTVSQAAARPAMASLSALLWRSLKTTRLDMGS